MFKQHLEMIGRNETPSKKAKFWQSYVRSLKGKCTRPHATRHAPHAHFFIPMRSNMLLHCYLYTSIGSDDIRAHETPKVRPTWRPLSSYNELPSLRSIYDEPSTASERITGAGYRYLPVHRETYGYSPRPIYSHHYNRPGMFSILALNSF